MKTKKTAEIGLVGLSHKTAPVEVRECFSLDSDRITSCLNEICSKAEEAVIVTTCNRVEIYFAACDMDKTSGLILDVLQKASNLPLKKIEEHIYKKYSREAVLHLLTVASSLDSLVVGENEISGQVKEAYRKSSDEKKTGQILNRLFHQAFKTAKRVRTETEISKSPLSVAYIATELARSIFEDISKRKALLIGAGEMGELILKYLTKYNIKEITIANRSFHNAERIANNINADARIITLEDIKTASAGVDIIISSVNSQHHIITHELAKNIIRARGSDPLFMIDISVPRSIDPEAGRLKNVFLYNIDDLKTISDENLKNRLQEVELAKQLIESDATEFYEWYEGLSLVPAIIKIQDKFNDIRHKEIQRYRKNKLRHLSEEDLKTIEELTGQIMAKTLHDPIMYLKSWQNLAGNEGKSIKESIRIIEKLLGSTIDKDE